MSDAPHADERFDNPIERLRLLGEDDDAIESFLDSLEVTSPREREMLGELARTRPVADADGFPAAHRPAIGALQSPAQAAVLGVIGAAIVLLAAHAILSGTALASRRIRLATAGPLNDLWRAVGWARRPPRDQSRTFAIVAITLTSLAWLV